MLRWPCRLIRSFAFARTSPSWPRSTYATAAAATAAHTASPPLQPRSPAIQASPVQLRDYQEECVRTVLTALADGRRQVGVSLATGSGKTVIFTELIGRVPPPIPNATQALILVHRQELVEQAARHCSARYPQKSVEIEMGKLHASGSADITVASVQSINSSDRMKKFDAHRFKLVLVDEAHHIVSPTYLNVLDHFGLQSETGSATAALVGVSATFSRADGLALGKAIKHIVYHKDYIDMIGQKWLSNVIFTTVQSKADISHVKLAASGDFVTSALSKAVDNDQTNLITVRSWIARAGDRKSTIAFCVDLAHVESLTNTFRMHGIDARFITGDTPKKIRSERLDAFKNRAFPVLLNCSVFTEGTDIPNIDCVLLARPTRSKNLLVQMIGRGMRLYQGKENCHVIDMVASLEGGIVTTPTLFGLDPSEVVEEADAAKMQKLKERRQAEGAREDNKAAVLADPAVTDQSINGSVTFTDYDSISELIDDTSGERHIRAISRYAWVCVGPERFVLVNGAKGSHLVIARSSGQTLYKVKYTAKLISQDGEDASYKVPYMRPRQIAQSETFEGAIHAADTFAKDKFIQMFILRRNAPWRNHPATDAQLKFLNKFRDEDMQLTVENTTKGKAADMITKVQFGARGQYRKIQVEKRKVDKIVRKEMAWEAHKKSEMVTVGPLLEPA